MLEDIIADGSITRISGPGGDIVIDTFEISHGPTPALGFLMDRKLAYSPDVWGINDDVLKRLDKVDVWILDALRYNRHPTHAHADRVLSWLARAKAKSAVLTNLHIDMDYATLASELPQTIRPAYDGMTVMA